MILCSGMARKRPIQYPGAIYHVMNRGGRREAVLEGDQDRERILKTLTRTIEPCPGFSVGVFP